MLQGEKEMELSAEKIQKARHYLDLAEKHLADGNKRMAVGSLDHVKDHVRGAIYITIAEIEHEEGEY